MTPIQKSYFAQGFDHMTLANLVLQFSPHSAKRSAQASVYSIYKNKNSLEAMAGQRQRETVPIKTINGKEQFTWRNYSHNSIVPNTKLDIFNSSCQNIWSKYKLLVSVPSFHIAEARAIMWLRGRSCMVTVLLAGL